MPLDRTFFGVFEPRSVSDACDDTKTPPISPSASLTFETANSIVPSKTSKTLLISFSS